MSCGHDFLHRSQLLLDLGDQGPQLLRPLLLGGHHVGGGLVQEAGVGQLALQALQLALLFAQVLGDRKSVV